MKDPPSNGGLLLFHRHPHRESITGWITLRVWYVQPEHEDCGARSEGVVAESFGSSYP